MGLTMLAAAVLALAGSPQSAPSPEEQRLFTEGLRAFEAGDARAAEKAWKAGYAVAHDPAFLVRIGEAQEKAGATPDAVESYRRYLREAPDAADRPDIEQRLARLGGAAPTAATPPPQPPEGAETPGELRPGGMGAAAGAPPALPAAPVRPAAVPAATDAEGGPGGPVDEETGWNALNITAWVATAVSVALLGTATFFGASAASKKDDVNRLLTYHDDMTGVPLEYADVAGKYKSATADGQRFDRDAKIALVSAGVAAAVATTFFIIDGVRGPERGGVALAPAPAPGGGGSAGALGVLWWRF